MTHLRIGPALLGLLWLILVSCLAPGEGRSPPGSGEAQPPPQNNLVYEIFVRSFCSSDSEHHPAGDLKGVTSKLDSYLNDGKPQTDQDLEVGILWLMPVFPSPSSHGYDVTDYRSVNAEYGTLDDLKTLVQEAHRRGVRVVLDIPFNHTSDRHPWFQDAVKKATCTAGRFPVSSSSRSTTSPAMTATPGSRPTWRT